MDNTEAEIEIVREYVSESDELKVEEADRDEYFGGKALEVTLHFQNDM